MCTLGPTVDAYMEDFDLRKLISIRKVKHFFFCKE